MKKLCPICQEEYPADVDACPTDGAKLMAVQDEEEVDPLLGQTLDGRYRVDELLGVGGMGAVYKAVQLTMNRPIALKVLKRELASDPEVVKRFLREAQAVSMLTHPNTITVYDFGQTPDDLLYIAMEYLEGRDLSDAIRNEAPMPVERALGILAEVAGALSEAHAKGIVHRDLKPDNVMLASIGGRDDQVKVLDFGIAKLNTSEKQTQLTKAGFTVGTPDYMAPEQAQALPTITHHADIYALGCILFECLAGRPPFVDDSAVSVLMAHCTGQVPRFAELEVELDVAPEVEDLVRWMLEKDPNSRPADADVLLGRIDVLRGGSTGRDTEAVPSADPALAPTPAPSGPLPNDELRLATDPTLEATGESALSVPDDLAAARPSELEIPGVSRFPVVPVAIAAVLLLAAAVAGFVFLAGGDDPVETPSAAAAAPVDVPAEPLELWVRSSPAGATVLEGEQALGETPLKVKVDPKRVRRLQLLLDGYAAFTVAVDPGMKEAPTVTLQPKRPAVKEAKDRKPKRRGTSRGKGRRKAKPKAAAPPAKAAKPSGGGLLYDDALK